MEKHNNGKAPLNKGILLGYPRKVGNEQDKFQEHLINRFYQVRGSNHQLYGQEDR